MRILIYGFGRMGLTHYAILNALRENIEFDIVEPNRWVRMLLTKNINANFFASDESLRAAYDLTLVTTPPGSHVSLVEKCLSRGDTKVFVEKPFGGHQNTGFMNETSSRVFVGYVLRYSPCIQWIKEHVNPKDIVSIKGEYLSNTIEKKPHGWRNGPYSGVLNEMGSHVIDLLMYITKSESFEVRSARCESVVTDVDDVVSAELETDSGIKAELHLNWVDKRLRKPVFRLELILNDGTLYHLDQQQIMVTDSSKNEVRRIGVTDLAANVDFYLRGVDFTTQMRELLQGEHELASDWEARAINQTIEKILNYEIGTGR